MPSNEPAPPNKPAASPETDLLERLATGDIPLVTAVTLFPRVDRAKKVVEACVRSEAVELICKREDAEAIVQPWRLRFVLNDPGVWGGRTPDAGAYHLRLTAYARERYLTDRERFFGDLFER